MLFKERRNSLLHGRLVEFSRRIVLRGIIIIIIIIIIVYFSHLRILRYVINKIRLGSLIYYYYYYYSPYAGYLQLCTGYKLCFWVYIIVGILYLQFRPFC
jgi:hypothetical protein